MLNAIQLLWFFLLPVNQVAMGRDNMQDIAPGAPAGLTPQPRERHAPLRTDIFTVGAVELARLAREREIPPVEIAEAFLSRQADLDPLCTPSARRRWN